MKITTLIENTKISNELEREHGLSLLIETGDKKILFDTGQSNNFAENASKLGIDLNTIDIAVLSHGHYDHGGGIKEFLQKNDHAPIYINKRAFEKHYHQNHYIGLDESLLNSDRIVFIDDEYDLSDSVVLRTNNQNVLKYPLTERGFYIERDGKRIPEDFHHEQYLEITENGKKVLFSGCSHKGILNIANWYSPDILIGGFHLMDIDLDENGLAYLDRIADELNSYQCKFFTCHCTGKNQYKYLKDKMKENLDYLSTGSEIII